MLIQASITTNYDKPCSDVCVVLLSAVTPFFFLRFPTINVKGNRLTSIFGTTALNDLSA